MREIKFRAWDKADKRMITDKQDFIPLIVTHFGVLRLSPTHEDSFYSIVDKEFEIMQYIGLKDKNGTLIYDCDIYHDDILNMNRIVDEITVANWIMDIDRMNNPSSFIEVIGNIYETPELLDQ